MVRVLRGTESTETVGLVGMPGTGVFVSIAVVHGAGATAKVVLELTGVVTVCD